MTRRSRLGLSLAVPAVGALLAGCGTTVPVTSQATAAQGGSGLSAGGDPTAAPGSATAGGAVAGSSTGQLPGGSTTGTVGGTGGTAVGGSAGSTASVGSTGSVAGVATGKGPVEIGFVLTSTASAADYGFSSGESYSERQIDQGLVDALNRQGGFLGRKIVPVFASTDPNSTNWSNDFAAACATLTQDHHVAAVLGYQFNYDRAFEACLTKKGIPHLTTGFNIPDATELARHPLHRALAVPTIDVRSRSKLEGSLRDGWLSSKGKLGAVIDSCPGTVESWNRVSKPFLDSHKIPYVLYTGSCSNGSADGANGAQQVPGALLKMRQEGVTAISFLSVSEGPALAVVANAAEAQGWHPLYLVSSLGNLSALSGNAGVVPPAQMANVKGYGWMPAQDLTSSRSVPLTASQKRCIALLRSSQITLSAFGDYTNAYRVCDAVFAYELALKATRANTAGPAVINALDGLGTAFNNPDVLDGATLLSRARANNAPAHVRAVVYDKSCSCFVYTGPTRPLQ